MMVTKATTACGTAIGILSFLCPLIGPAWSQAPNHEHTVTVIDGTLSNLVFTAPEATDWNWRLTVNAGGGWRHIVPSQTPNLPPWIPQNFTPQSGYWSVPATPDSPERHFQITFHGRLRREPEGEGSGAGEPPEDGEWTVIGETDSEYFVLPSYLVACVDNPVTLNAVDENDAPVNSSWSIQPAEGVTPDPGTWPEGPSITFNAANPAQYTVTGVSVDDPTLSDSARVTIIKVEIESFIAEPGSEPGDQETIVLGYDKGRVTYKIEPAGFTADSVELKIKNANGVLVFKQHLAGKTGGVTYTFDWDGKWNQSPNDNPAIYAKPVNGPYKAQITITKDTLSCDSNEDTVKTKGKAIVESLWTPHDTTIKTKMQSLGFDDVHVDQPPCKATAIDKLPLRLVFYVASHGSYSATLFYGPWMPDADNVLYHTDIPATLAYEVVFMNCCNSNRNPNRNNFKTMFGSRAYLGWEGEAWNVNAVEAAKAFFDGLAADMRVYHAYLAAYEDYVLDSARLRFTGDGTRKLNMK